MFTLCVDHKDYNLNQDTGTETFVFTATPTPDAVAHGLSSQLLINTDPNTSLRCGRKYYLLSEDEFTPPVESTP